MHLALEIVVRCLLLSMPTAAFSLVTPYDSASMVFLADRNYLVRLVPSYARSELGPGQRRETHECRGERNHPWTSRHGHAVAALDFSDDYVRSTGQKARLFVLGGDSNVQGSQDLRAYPGGGAMRNDVWSTTGPTWNVQTNILKTTKWGDPLPQIVANVTWLQTNNGKRPPRGITYSEWISCAAAAWAVNPPSGCDDPTKPPGAYLADNMFSPRRNFVALAFQNELFVFGVGRVSIFQSLSHSYAVVRGLAPWLQSMSAGSSSPC